jgi:hypothetical protein
MRILALALLAAVSLGSLPAAARHLEPAPHRAAGFAPAGGALVELAEEEARSLARTTRPPPRKKRTPRPAPDPRRTAPPPARANPSASGLGAAGGAAGGALIGGLTVGLSGLILAGVFATPTLPVIITASIVAVVVGLATPFLAAVGGGAAVLLMDPRSKPDDWQGLLQCAASGYCAGLTLVGGTLLAATPCGGMPCGGTPQPGLNDIVPGPDEPAQWTAGAAIAGLIGGTLLGGLVGWAVAPTPDDPLVPIAVGAIGGAILGTGVSAGSAAAIATAIRR